jgi:hypothetical protein
VARGVLIDYVRYAQRKGITYDPLGPHAISLQEIQEIIAEQRLEIRRGDILIVRCGLSKYIRASSPDDKSPFDSAYTHVGVDPTDNFLEWLWNQNVAAIAGDALAFEAIPASDGTCMCPRLSDCFRETDTRQISACTDNVFPVGGCQLESYWTWRLLQRSQRRTSDGAFS